MVKIFRSEIIFSKDILLFFIITLILSGFFIVQNIDFKNKSLFVKNYILVENDTSVLNKRWVRGVMYVYFEYLGKEYHSPCSDENKGLLPLCEADLKDRLVIKKMIFLKPFPLTKVVLITSGSLVVKNREILIYSDNEWQASFIESNHNIAYIMLIFFYTSAFYIIIFILLKFFI